MDMYIFWGLPGAGKTTLARRWSAEIGALLIDSDALALPFTDLDHRKLFSRTFAVLENMLRNNPQYTGPIVFTDSLSNPKNVKSLLEIGQTTSAEMKFLKVICSPETAFNRIQSRREKQVVKNTFAELCEMETTLSSYGISSKEIPNRKTASIDQNLELIREFYA